MKTKFPLPSLKWTLHWLTAILVGLTYAFWLPDSLLSLARTKGHFWHSLHISVGLLVLMLAVIRLLRVFSDSPRKNAGSARRGARLVQLGLLLVLMLAASTGYITFRQPVLGAKILFLGVWPLPDLSRLGPAQALRFVHETLSYGLAILIAVHILIGLQDRKTFRSMIWPRRTRARPSENIAERPTFSSRQAKKAKRSHQAISRYP